MEWKPEASAKTSRCLPSRPQRTHCLAGAVVVAALIVSESGCDSSSERPEAAPHSAPVHTEPVTSSSVQPDATKPLRDEPRDSVLRFRDVAERSGLRFTYRNGNNSDIYSIVESLGGGVAVLDYDRDGLQDVYVTGGGGFQSDGEPFGLPGALFRQRALLQFESASAEAGVADAAYYNHAAVSADYDADGFPDLLVTGYGGLVLYRNQGDGTFRVVTARAGLEDPSWSSTAAFGDVNGDGLPDLYVAHYVNWSPSNNPECYVGREGQRDVCPPKQFEPLADRLFANVGTGQFEDISDSAGLRDDGKGLGLLLADTDHDGDLDIYVANDTVDNFHYLNDGQARFREVGFQTGMAFSAEGVPEGSMGVALGDPNGDGHLDLCVANYERESLALYRNTGRGIFQHISRRAGLTTLSRSTVGWGLLFFDGDRDADEDLFVSNGHVVRFPTESPVRQRPLLLENTEQGFRDVAASAGAYLDAPHPGRGVAAADIDNDGDVDLIVSHINEPIALLSNESPTRGHWIGLELIGIESDRDAVGAFVTLTAGGRTQVRHVAAGIGYASTSDRRAHFGLGETDEITAIEVRWPSGTLDRLEFVPCDQYVQVLEGQTR